MQTLVASARSLIYNNAIPITGAAVEETLTKANVLGANSRKPITYYTMILTPGNNPFLERVL